jgi:hypothetical protein
MCCTGGYIETTSNQIPPGQQVNDLCTDPVNGCCGDNCQPKYPVNTTNVFTCGDTVVFGGYTEGDTDLLAGTFYYEVEPYVEYVLIYASESSSPRRFIVRANGECGTRLLDTGYLGRVPSLATCGVKSAPCCLENSQTGDICTGIFNQTCPGRYVTPGE